MRPSPPRSTATPASSARPSPTAWPSWREERHTRRPRLPGSRDVVHAGRHARARLLLRLRRAAGHADGPRRRSSPPPSVVATWDERRLAGILREYGEERYARQIARAIVRTPGRQLRSRPRHSWSTSSPHAIPTPARFAGGPPGQALLPGDPHRRQRRAARGRRRAPARLGLPGGRRAPGGDLVPLARGPARQALSRRSGPGLRLPARLPRLHLRSDPAGRAADPPLSRPHARRDRRQPPFQVSAAARGPKAPRRGPRRMTPPAATASPHAAPGSTGSAATAAPPAAGRRRLHARRGRRVSGPSAGLGAMRVAGAPAVAGGGVLHAPLGLRIARRAATSRTRASWIASSAGGCGSCWSAPCSSASSSCSCRCSA